MRGRMLHTWVQVYSDDFCPYHERVFDNGDDRFSVGGGNEHAAKFWRALHAHVPGPHGD